MRVKQRKAKRINTLRECTTKLLKGIDARLLTASLEIMLGAGVILAYFKYTSVQDCSVPM